MKEKHISYIWIVPNASESLVHWFCHVILHVLSMCYILGSPTSGTPTDPPTDTPLTSKTTDYANCSYLILKLHWFIDSLLGAWSIL